LYSYNYSAIFTNVYTSKQFYFFGWINLNIIKNEYKKGMAKLN